MLVPISVIGYRADRYTRFSVIIGKLPTKAILNTNLACRLCVKVIWACCYAWFCHGIFEVCWARAAGYTHPCGSMLEISHWAVEYTNKVSCCRIISEIVRRWRACCYTRHCRVVCEEGVRTLLYTRIRGWVLVGRNLYWASADTSQSIRVSY